MEKYMYYKVLVLIFIAPGYADLEINLKLDLIFEPLQFFHK